MPRKATKSTGAPASRSSSKRPAPDVPARQSKRARAAIRKSYVEPESDTDNEDRPKKVQLSNGDYDDDEGVASDYEEHSDKDPSSESEPDETATDDDIESKRPTPRGRTTKNLPIHKKAADEKELWRPGAKLAPGTQLVIKKPKARDAGDTPYLDHTIHPNTMLFLKDLAANNDRQWLKLHDPDFRVSFQDFITFAEKVSDKIIEADETIPELPVKDVIYRIYRDIRFSKDPTPYKTYFSAAWSRTGRKGPYAHYYVQVQPKGGSFVGGGFWQPDATTLAKLRRDIDRKPHKFKAVLTDAGIREAFLGGVKDDEKKAVKAFTSLSMNQSNALKRNPKGYDHDHKDIELLRLRNFTMGRKLTDDEIVGVGGLERVGELVANMVPFITYLNSIAMPDDDTSDSSDGDGSDAEPDNDSGAAEDDEA
ncbi:hypothetical protein CC77DRAFT_1046695 [Alternaria alternata]|uniref:Uncharacterized protein n=2 Tax=Alternaria alternata complex TaxID=187734 RepID=A0A177E0D0_ALTAL|nr:hypothetical protein CC77DRAFT_1046695 [Alternaria alternata]OAG25423.1 hypothetical protein CC77DRAFT_1046695 [Alternaria alternata]RYN30403.1 hypothetical protein AA0115_g4723 [Alternaria tenuissima]